MINYHMITAGDVGRLDEAIVSAVEMESDNGRRRPDWHRVLDRVENSEEGLDLGTDMSSPVIKEILSRGRAVYRDLAEA